MSKSITTEQILNKLPERFQPDQAKDMDVVFQFKLTDKFDFYIEILNQKCTIIMEEHDDPNIILSMSEETFNQLMSGQIDGMSAYLKGLLKAQGNVILATSLSKLFKRTESDLKKMSS